MSANPPPTKDELRRLAAAKVHPGSNPLTGWSHAITELPQGGLTLQRSATAQENNAIAKSLEVLDVEHLTANYHLKGIAGGGCRVCGSISAVVSQACVVTLDPVTQIIEESFDSEFWRSLESGDGGEEKGILNGPTLELLEGDEIPVGRLVFEALSAALDPYPRKADAHFDWQGDYAASAGNTGPFAVLSKLKDKL